MFQHAGRRRFSHFAFAVMFFLGPVALAASPVRELDRSTLSSIRSARKSATIVLPNVVLSDTDTVSIELEEFAVWAPDATIVVYDSDPPRRMALPARRYFKGRVAGQPAATVFFSTATDSSDVSGLILIGEKTFTIRQGRQLPGRSGPKARKEAPIFIDVVDASREGFAGTSFECATENVTLPHGKLSLPARPVTLSVTDAAYELRIAIESDNEFYATFGAANSTTDAAVSTYIGDLVAQTSVIYMRDLNTTLNIGLVNIRPSNVEDPFVATGHPQVLQELGTYWNANYKLPDDDPETPPGVPRSATIMLSGRVNGGAAHTDRICDIDRGCGLNCWSGAYAVNGSVGETTVPNPNATVDGVVYGLGINHLMLQGFAHELGHVIGSNHTHCTDLTPAEKTAYNVTRDYVDLCFVESNPGCFSGSTSVPFEKGTIMSYCYLQTRASGYPESRYVLGELGKPSQKILEILTDKLEYALSTNSIIVGTNLPCSAGQTASEDGGCAGLECTYSWAISGGSIQGSTTGTSISFTPNAAALTLTFSIANEKGCKITRSFATTSQCATTLGPPANLVATAATSTSVQLSWTAVAGAASYAVERSADTVAYAIVGTPAGALFTDTTPLANTSYLYRVAARDGAATTGAFGPTDLATTIIFTGDPAVAGTGVVQGVHMTELRTAVNATRVLAQLGAATFTDSIGPLVPVKKTHVDELRANLNASRAALGLVELSYTDPSITAFSTTIKAAHFNELRTAVK